MYTDSRHQKHGGNAKLQLALPKSESPSCLTFYYHMHGNRWIFGTLNVYNGNVKIFSKSGDQGNTWKKVTATLHPSDVVSVMSIVCFID